MKIHPVAADLFHTDRQTDRYDEASSLRMGLKWKKYETTKVSVEQNIDREKQSN